MCNLILSTPPWVSCDDPEWVRERSRVEAKYQSDGLPGSYRRLTLMLSNAWEKWAKQKERPQ